MSYYKRIGVYDRKIQKLANSRTVQVVFSCLALAELDVVDWNEDPEEVWFKQSVANIDERITQPPLSDDEGIGGPPSTAVFGSLFDEASILGFFLSSLCAKLLARSSITACALFLSRSVISFTGAQIVGEWLDGCSHETLNFFVVSLNQAAILLYDTSINSIRWNEAWELEAHTEYLFSLAQSVPDLLSETVGPMRTYPYDWRLGGMFYYVVGLLVTFVSLTCVEGSSLSLLTKLSPPRSRSLALHVSTLSVFLAFAARSWPICRSSCSRSRAD